MSDINYEKFVTDLVVPLINHAEELVVKAFTEEDDVVSVQIMVHSDDVGRVIGRKGRVINAIRTIAHACAARYGKKIEISVDSF